MNDGLSRAFGAQEEKKRFRYRIVPLALISLIAIVGAFGATLAFVPFGPKVRADGAAMQRSVQALAESGAVRIVEPAFKPPATWAYDPPALTVKVGTKVTWTNTGAVAHTVTADDGDAFDSGDIEPKASFSLDARSPGRFSYHCIYHPWMKGSLVVVP